MSPYALQELPADLQFAEGILGRTLQLTALCRISFDKCKQVMGAFLQLSRAGRELAALRGCRLGVWFVLPGELFFSLLHLFHKQCGPAVFGGIRKAAQPKMLILCFQADLQPVAERLQVLQFCVDGMHI